MPGCHKGAELFTVKGNNIASYNTESAIAFHHVISFLQKQGTTFDFGKLNLSQELVCLSDDMNLTEPGKINLRRLYNNVRNEVEKELAYTRPTKRAMHFGNKIFMRSAGKYVNSFHQELENKSPDSNDILLNIQYRKPKPIVGYTTRAIQLMVTLGAFMYFTNAFSSVAVEDAQEGNSHQHSL